jgi:hypothetical protein
MVCRLVTSTLPIVQLENGLPVRRIRQAGETAGEETRLVQSLLLRKVKCPCGQRFTVEWAEPVHC